MTDRDASPFEVREPLLLVSIGRTWREGMDAMEVYGAVRFAWVIDLERARDYGLVLAHAGGVVRGAYRPELWLPATREHFPDEQPRDGRWGFHGHPAEAEAWREYVGKRVPGEYREGRNPIRYCDPS